ncbi:MAG: dynamin family protein [Myxococcales bacterium]|nr:dynamin family protein [Myxococcota bacterium]MDW8280632.1 dynamin family protein [Myxococcales bacterium]
MSALLPEHKEIKAALLSAMDQIARLAEGAGMSTLAGDLRHVRIPKLEEERFSVVVLGEFNHGKSTFVNALLGAPVLPAGITPTTATINHLVYAETPCARAVLVDGTSCAIEPRSLAEWVTIDGARTKEVQYVEVGWPAEILRDRVTLVDTPGVNDLNEARAEITYNYIPRSDVVLFLLDGAQALKQSERAFLEQRILKRSKDKLIFIIGKADLLAQDEREETLRYCRKHLQQIIDNPVIFLLSAKQALTTGDLEGSGMGPFVAYLRRYLSEERGRVLLDNASADGLRLAGYLRQNLGIKRRSLQLSLEELEARVARVRAELVGKQHTLRQIQGRITAEAEAVKARVRMDLDDFTAAFCAALPDEIDRADAADVRKYLQPFLQDTIKSWAEQEGDRVAALLERLAEEIIQITNENVQQAMATVAAELGPADTQVELTVDTLKYDVGIFAIGALGTGIFLFVNTFVGGLLTMAAPIIAVLVHGRIASQIKAQAKEQAPEVVRRACAAVAPRFMQIIDDFAGRLSDFVTAAGEALHRGISEMLDRALAERRMQGMDIEARDRELQEQLQVLGTIEQHITELRQRLWTSLGDSTDSPPRSAS